MQRATPSIRFSDALLVLIAKCLCCFVDGQPSQVQPSPKWPSICKPEASLLSRLLHLVCASLQVRLYAKSHAQRTGTCMLVLASAKWLFLVLISVNEKRLLPFSPELTVQPGLGLPWPSPGLPWPFLAFLAPPHQPAQHNTRHPASLFSCWY